MSPAASGRHLSARKTAENTEMPHPMALFALNLIQYRRRLQTFCVNNIGNVFKLSGVAFHLAPTCGGLLLIDQPIKMM